MENFNLVSIIPLFVVSLYLGGLALVIYVVFTVLKRMKERNTYLQEIRDELRKQNNKG